jgi:uncharacterized membrane protein YkvA (DUF1232 family)
MTNGKASILDRLRMVKDKKLPSREEILSVLSKSAGKIPFADDVVAMWYCAMDDGTPSKVKISIIGALAYLVLPLDVIPDVIAGLGFSDDITVLTAVLALVSAHIKPEHRTRAKEALSINEKPDDEMPIRPMD